METFSNTTIVVIDDHPLFRKGVAELINEQDGFELIGEAASGEEGLMIVQSNNPDLVLLDLNMKGMSGMDVLKSIKKTDLSSLVIILTVSNLEQDLINAFHCGADGYLLKDTEPEILIGKLKDAAKGKIIIDDALVSVFSNAMRENRSLVSSDINLLSAREREILVLIVKGMSNKLIAAELDITEGTVKVHVKNILRKLNLKSRLQAAIWAIGNEITE